MSTPYEFWLYGIIIVIVIAFLFDVRDACSYVACQGTKRL